MQLGRTRLSPVERLRQRHLRLCLQLIGTVSWSQVSFPLEVFVDSGADDNFIDSCLVSQFNLSTESLPTAKDVVALDGRLVGRVTHHTAPLIHHKSISLFIISSPLLKAAQSIH